VKTGIQYLSDSDKIEEDTMENPLRSQLVKESAMVAADSMVVLEEFERFEEDLSFDESDDERIPHLRVGSS
jgi:hypothetical protein